MNELVEFLYRFLPTVERSFDELDDEEAEQIASFLQEAFAVLSKSNIQNNLEPQIPQGTDLLWILSGNDPNAFVNYLRTYPGPGFKELAANPARLAQVIEKLAKNSPVPPITEDSQGIPDTQLPSSNVAGMKYDPQSKRLLVKFHGVNQEPVYQYSDVPPQIFSILQHGNAFAQTRGKNRWGEWWPMKNPSIGAALNQYLKAGGYAYQRLS